MQFLTWLGGLLVKVGLEKIIELCKDLYTKYQAKKESKKHVEAVKTAQTIEEQEKAHEELVIRTRPKR